MEDILSRFKTATKGSAHAEIRLRAANLAAQWNKDAEVYRETQQARRLRSHEKLRTSALAVAIGGDESEPGSRRPSHEGRRSLDVVRRSMEKSRRRLGLQGRSHSSDMSDCGAVQEILLPVDIPLPQTCYLLISPLLPPISSLATMFSSMRSSRSPYCEEAFAHKPTMAIYGDEDFFTSPRKLRKWAENLKGIAGSHFQFREIAGAGHFWREEDSDRQMRTYIRDWLQDLSFSYLSKG